jgi:hypothetical protein
VKRPCDFKPDNEGNTMKQANLLIVKWLFDQRYLVLPEEVDQQGLSFNDDDIQKFIQAHLKNHVWDNQCNQGHELSSFLYHMTSRDYYETTTGEKVGIRIKHLVIREAGVWEKYQQLSEQWKLAAASDPADYGGQLESLERSTRLNEIQQKALMKTLTAAYQAFKTTRKDPNA